MFPGLSGSELLSTLQRVRAVLTLKPFDGSTPEGRSNERWRRMVLNFGTAMGAKGVSALLGIITVPIALQLLGLERYGLYITIISVVSLFVFLDLGLGSGLVNEISGSLGRDDRQDGVTAVSSTFFALTAISFLLVLIFGGIYGFVSWGNLFNVETELAKSEAGPAFLIYLCVFALNLPLGIIQKVQFGFQDGYITNFWQMGISVCAFLGLAAAGLLGVGLPVFILLVAGSSALVWSGCFLWSFLRRYKGLFPSLRNFNWIFTKRLFRTGIKFTIISLTSIVGMTTNTIIIARLVGPEAVARYAVTEKLFILTVLANTIFIPLWPAFNEALNRGDHSWVKKTLIRSLTLSFGMSLLTGLLLFGLGKPIIEIWAGAEVVPEAGLLLGFAAWGIVGSMNTILNGILNTTQFLDQQIKLAVASSLVSLTASILLTGTMQETGAIWGSVIGYGLFFTAPAIWMVYNKFKTQKA